MEESFISVRVDQASVINMNNAIEDIVVQPNRRLLKILTNSAVRYSSKYVRKQTGTLEKSGILDTVYEEGIIKYNTPYAEKVYNYGVPLRNKNPFARLKWVEYAYETHKSDIIEEANEWIRREYN